MPFKSGFISILGRPNVGKSTLFNRILGEKMAIVSKIPQTTRNRILGIKHLEGGQLIFLDTPGIHKGKTELNQRMSRTAIASGRDADVLLFMTEVPSPPVEKDRELIGSFRRSGGIPVLAINKIDLVKKESLLPLIDQYQRLHPFRAIVPVSAMTGEGVDALITEILRHLPESPPYYPDDMVTDQTERFLVSEIIREKLIDHCYQEIPYATAVTIDEFKEQTERNLVLIKATVHVERDSQKKIVIGKGGQRLKKVGQDARREIEGLLEKRVFLELWVNVEKNWTRDPRALNRLGYPFA